MKEPTPAVRRALRARAHGLDPIVMIGAAGLTPAVLREIDIALKSHELIKVRMLGDDRWARRRAIESICAALGAVPVQLVGKVLVIHRPAPEQDVRSPATTRRERRRTKRSFQD